MSRLVSPLLLLLSLTADLGAQAKVQVPPENPAEKHLRAVIEARIAFSPPVFASEDFPACAFEDSARAKELLGPYQIKVRFYNQEHQLVKKAETLRGAIAPH